MKIVLFLAVLAGGTLFSGCATGRNLLVLDAVGPVPGAVQTAASTNGALVVYSAQKVNADFNACDPYRLEYSDYRLFTADGKWLQRIHNSAGTMLQAPARVTLPAGRYRVVARANGYSQVTVPVIVAAQRDTVLHLEGDGNWPEAALFNQTNAVRLPDGQIAGFRYASEPVL